MRELFRQCVDSRLAACEKMPNLRAAKAELDRSLELQGLLWKQAVAACQTPEGPPVLMPVVTALNAMFDIVTGRTMALQTIRPRSSS